MNREIKTRTPSGHFVASSQARLTVDLGDPGSFCINRRKDSPPREFQSCMGSLRCRAEGSPAYLDENM
jgi:hypothetical protein